VDLAGRNHVQAAGADCRMKAPSIFDDSVTLVAAPQSEIQRCVRARADAAGAPGNPMYHFQMGKAADCRFLQGRGEVKSLQSVAPV
jgi:hypothetical protein